MRPRFRRAAPRNTGPSSTNSTRSSTVPMNCAQSTSRRRMTPRHFGQWSRLQVSVRLSGCTVSAHQVTKTPSPRCTAFAGTSSQATYSTSSWYAISAPIIVECTTAVSRIASRHPKHGATSLPLIRQPSLRSSPSSIVFLRRPTPPCSTETIGGNACAPLSTPSRRIQFATIAQGQAFH